jgi:hypothetical protein
LLLRRKQRGIRPKASQSNNNKQQEEEMSGVSVTLYNNTTDNNGKSVTFGLYEAPHNWSEDKEVAQGKTNSVNINAGGRTVAAWIDKNTLYPNNSTPYLIGFVFEDYQDYMITLTDENISVQGPEGSPE